jgi:hypothetical protein
MLVEGVWVENLVRFPVEKRARPSFEMMSELAPDCRTIDAIVEALDVQDFDPDVGDEADFEMADRLATMMVPRGDPARADFFAALREESLAPAIAACIEAKRLAEDTHRACRRAIDALVDDPLNAFALGRRANHFANASAEAALEAHRLCEIARGRCRALSVAERGEQWLPYSAHVESDWLVEAEITAKRAANG